MIEEFRPEGESEVAPEATEPAVDEEKEVAEPTSEEVSEEEKETPEAVE